MRWQKIRSAADQIRRIKEAAVVDTKHTDNKEIGSKAAGSIGAISGAASVLGSWQVCHNICLGLIALLSVIGITITGMPLEFFTKIAVPVWSFAVVLLIVTAFLFFHKRCISKKLLIFNTGLIIAGIPFLQQYSAYFLSVGGMIAMSGAALFVRDRLAYNRADKKNIKKFDFTNAVLYSILVIALIVLATTMFSTFWKNAQTQINAPAFDNKASAAVQKNEILQADNTFKRITAGTTNDGDVEIALKPNNLENGILEVDFALNTHSVDTNSFDLLKITTLEYDGKSIMPSSAPKLSGHHVSGKLVFDVGKEIDKFVIKIKGIPMVEERIFEWGSQN